MRRFRLLAAATLLFLAAPAASADSAKELIGAWTLVSSTIQQGANTIQPFGADPKGSLIFDANGRYAAIIARPGLPKLASDNRTAATPEETKAIVAGSIAHFGSYAADDKVITFRIENGTHPNWDGAEQKLTYTLSGDALTYSVSSAAVGGGAATLVWRRAK